jgi:hypothetical protein
MRVLSCPECDSKLYNTASEVTHICDQCNSQLIRTKVNKSGQNRYSPWRLYVPKSPVRKIQSVEDVVNPPDFGSGVEERRDFPQSTASKLPVAQRYDYRLYGNHARSNMSGWGTTERKESIRRSS